MSNRTLGSPFSRNMRLFTAPSLDWAFIAGLCMSASYWGQNIDLNELARKFPHLLESNNWNVDDEACRLLSIEMIELVSKERRKRRPKSPLIIIQAGRAYLYVPRKLFTSGYVIDPCNPEDKIDIEVLDAELVFAILPQVPDFANGSHLSKLTILLNQTPGLSRSLAFVVSITFF